MSCWGRRNLRPLGNGGTSDKYTPTLTSSLGTGRTAVALSSGDIHTCAILDNGDVSCWGDGYDGQLGNGRNISTNTPTLTSSLGTGRTAVAISSGYSHTCAILDNGFCVVLGKRNLRPIGQRWNIQQRHAHAHEQPRHRAHGRGDLFRYTHTCAILDNGNVACWGDGFRGQLGNGGTSGQQKTPTLTSSLGTGRTAVALSSNLPTPAPSSTTVLCHAGDTEMTANW